MPITLVTGTPGAGKTLFAVKMLVDEILPTGRRVVTNINGLDIDNPNLVHDAEAPFNWFEYDHGTYFVFDEVQTEYPFKNSMSKTAEYISRYETHRHLGMDFVFITQGPNLLDRHLFPLIDRHFHLYRPFRLKRSTILQWNGVNPTPQPKQTRANAITQNFRFPKRLYGLYKSAEVHTVVSRPPWRLIASLGAIFGLIALAFYGIAVVTPNTRLFSQAGDELTDLETLLDEGPQISRPSRSCLQLISANARHFVAQNGANHILLDRTLVHRTDNRLISTTTGETIATLC